MADIKPYVENEDDFIYWKIRRKDSLKFYLYSEKLRKRLDEKKLVPELSIYRKLMDLILPKEQDEEEYISERTSELTNIIVSHFENDETYFFSIKKRVKNERYEADKMYIDVDTGKGASKSKIISYSSNVMIAQAVSTAFYIFSNKEIKEEDKKEKIIQTCYKEIMGYAAKSKESSEKITHYKATVISGYIAMELGYTLSKNLNSVVMDKMQPSNEEVFNGTKYLTGSLKQAKKKKSK